MKCKNSNLPINFIGKSGKWVKNNIIPLNKFDINLAPDVCKIEKFIDENGEIMVNMWYGSMIQKEV